MQSLTLTIVIPLGFFIAFLSVILCRFPKSKSFSDWHYGNRLPRTMARYEKLDYMFQKLKLDIQFLETCLNNDLSPTLARYKISNKRLQNSENYVKLQGFFCTNSSSSKM